MGRTVPVEPKANVTSAAPGPTDAGVGGVNSTVTVTGYDLTHGAAASVPGAFATISGPGNTTTSRSVMISGVL